MELILSDLEQIERKLPQLQKKAKSRDPEVLKEVTVLEKAKELLE